MNNRLNIKRDVLGIINASCFDTIESAIESEVGAGLEPKARQQAYWCFNTPGHPNQFEELHRGIEGQMIAEMETKLSHR